MTEKNLRTIQEIFETRPKTPEARINLDWLTDYRKEAYEKYSALGLPTQKKEAWKYIPLELLLTARFAEAQKTAPRDFSLDQADALAWPSEANRLVFVNGVHAGRISLPRDLPHGVSLETLDNMLEFAPQMLREWTVRSLSEEKNPFSLINAFSFNDGLFVHVPKNTDAGGVLDALFISAGSAQSPVVFQPRILVVLESGAKADLILNFAGERDARVFSNTLAEFYIGEGAALNLSTIQREGKENVSFVSSRFIMEKESVLKSVSVIDGGRLTRNESVVKFIGESAFASLKSLSVLSGESQVFHNVTADHRAPHCTSRQYYKSILTDRTRTEFNSLVHVRKGAVKSDSHQLSKNLLLSDTAQCYARPKLRINTDDVSCAHGATAGQIETDELQYLRSRGLKEDFARYVLAYGFAEELLSEIKPDHLKEKLDRLVSRQIQEAIGTKVST